MDPYYTNHHYQVDPNLVAARKLGITNAQYQVDQNLVAAQKLGLTNVVPVAQPFPPLPGTNQYPTYPDPAGGYQMHSGSNEYRQVMRENTRNLYGNLEKQKAPGGYGQPHRGFQQPLSGTQPPPSNKAGRGGRRTLRRGGGRTSISEPSKPSLKASYPYKPAKSTIKPDLSFNFKLFDKFEDGMMFLCNKATEEECLKNMIFAASASMMENMTKITDKTALFLYRLIPNRCVLHGVFQAEGVPGLELIPGAFGGRFPAQIRVKPFFRFPYPVPNDRLEKVLKDDNRCRKLSKRETQLLFREFSTLYMRDTLLTYLTRQMGLNEFVPICSMAFDFTSKEMEEIGKSCFEFEE